MEDKTSDKCIIFACARMQGRQEYLKQVVEEARKTGKKIVFLRQYEEPKEKQTK